MEFREIRLTDREWVERNRLRSGLPYTAYAFASLYMWRETYGLTIAGDDSFFVIHSDDYGGYFCPCGERVKCTAFLEQASEPVFFCGKKELQRLTAEGFRAEEMPELDEYVCSMAGLALESNENSPNYRRRLRKLKKEYTYQVEEIKDSNVSEVLEMLQMHLRLQEQEEREDLMAIKEAITHRKELGIQGILLRMESGERTFIIGYENLKDQFTMCGFLADAALPRSVIALCIHELAKAEYKEYPYCNIEEDLGLEGLRRAKRFYSPLYLEHVYRVER